MGVVDSIIDFLRTQNSDIPEVFAKDVIDKVLHLIMLSKLKNPQIFTYEGWEDTWNNWDSLSELDQEYILALRVVCQLFDDNLILN